MHPAGRLNSREGYSSYVSPGTYELRRFTGPIKRHVTSTVQELIKGQPRTGLNRHRRGYAIKEAASGIHSQDVGSYWARPVSIFKLSSYHHHFHHQYFHHITSVIF